MTHGTSNTQDKCNCKPRSLMPGSGADLQKKLAVIIHSEFMVKFMVFLVSYSYNTFCQTYITC